MARLVDRTIASYEDSHQIHSVTGFPPKVRMKKLQHKLKVVVEGPDNMVAHAAACVERAIMAGLLAGIIASYATAGLGAKVGWAVAHAQIVACLGQGYDVRLEDESEWDYWYV